MDLIICFNYEYITNFSSAFRTVTTFPLRQFNVLVHHNFKDLYIILFLAFYYFFTIKIRISSFTFLKVYATPIRQLLFQERLAFGWGRERNALSNLAPSAYGTCDGPRVILQTDSSISDDETNKVRWFTKFYMDRTSFTKIHVAKHIVKSL